jgi:uncharacterized protein involved in exopolysaccharide biosynthesis
MEDFRAENEEQKMNAGSTVDTGGSVKSLGETFLDFFVVVARRRRFIFWFVFSVTLVATLFALLSPKWYQSTASVFPAEQASILTGLEGVSSLFKSLTPSRALSSLTGSSEADRYLAILKSDRVSDGMIKKFDLERVYDFAGSSSALEKTKKELAGNTQIELQDEGNLTVAVYDRDPQQAAAMANYYIVLLNETNSELHVQNARSNREYIEQRYNKNLADLREAEETMKLFQVRHGVFAVPEQAEATIKAGAELYAMLAEKEIALAALKRNLSESHPTVAAAEVEVQEIRRKLDDMNSGAGKQGDDVKILVPFKQAPDLGIQYVRLYRNLEIQNKILEFLTPLYEQARIEERRSTPSVVVLDTASVPERKAKPKVALYGLLAFVISLVVSLFIVLAAEAIGRLRNAHPDKVAAVTGALWSDWFGLRPGGSSGKGFLRRNRNRN